jgi:pyruvate kinase
VLRIAANMESPQKFRNFSKSINVEDGIMIAFQDRIAQFQTAQAE